MFTGLFLRCAVLPRSPVARGGLAVLLLGALVVGVLRASERGNDFDGFHEAAAQVVFDGTLDTGKSVRRYPPTFPVLMAPLGALPLVPAAVLWSLLTLMAMADLPRRLARLAEVDPEVTAPAFLISLPFLIDNLVLGQSGPLLLWMGVAGVERVRRGGGAVGGAMLGLAAAIKVIPAGLLAVPVLRGRAWSATLGFGLAMGLAGALTLALVGVDETRAGLERWSAELRAQAPAELVARDRSLRMNNQSVPITLARTLGDLGQVRPRGALDLADLPLPPLWVAAWAIQGAAVALGLAAAFVARGRRDARAWELTLALALLGLLILSPLVWTHYFLLALPAWAALREHGRLRPWLGSIFVLGLAAPPLRSLGLHMAVVLTLFVVLALELVRPAAHGIGGAPAGILTPRAERPRGARSPTP